MTDGWPPPGPPGGESPPPPRPPPPSPPTGRPGRPGPPGHPDQLGPPGGGRNRRGLLVALGIVAVVVAVGALVLAGDDGDDGADGPPAGVTLDDVEGALLTLEDVGGDYDVDDEDDDGDDPLETDSVETSDECRTALESFEASEEAQQQVSAQFVTDTEGTLEHTITLPAEDQPSLADTRRAIDQCDTIEYEDDEAAGTFSFATSDADGPGDEAFATTIDVEVEAEGFTFAFEMYGVTWEREGVVSSVTGFAGFDEASFQGLPADRNQVDELAALADERLAGVLAG